jgi:hypothetical protein
MRITLLCIFLFQITIASDISNVDLLNVDWQESGESCGVMVYKQKNHSGKLVAVRGTTVIDAPMALVLTILTNDSYEKQREWVPNLREFTKLSGNNMLKRSLYVHVGFIWPVKDRDFAYTADIVHDTTAKRVVVEYTSSDLLKPAVKNVIRGEMKTVFILRALDDNRTAIDLRAIADPKGAIPPFVINLAQRDYSENMLNQIRVKIDQERLTTNVHKDFALFN